MRKLVIAGFICLIFTLPVLAQAAPTGDALYDQFSALALAQAKTVNLSAADALYNPALLPDAQLTELEPQFGSDSRYWELRAWTAGAADNLYYPGSAAEDAPAVIDLLRKARDCGSASPYALWRLATMENNERRKQLDALFDAAGNLSPEARAQAIALNADCEAKMAADLDAIIAQYPAEAWPHYWKADYWLSLGELAAGGAELDAGNAAPSCSYPAHYPESMLRQRLWRGEPCGDKMLAGAVLYGGQQYLTNAIRWKEHGKDLVVAMTIGGYQPALNSFQRFACRVGASEGSGFGDALVCEVLVQILGGPILTQSAADLSQEQILTLVRARDKCQSIRLSLVRARAGGEERWGELRLSPPPAPSFADQGKLGELVVTLSILRAQAKYLLPRQRYENFADGFAAEQQNLREAVAPVFAELAQLDYSSLSWPETWGEDL